MRFMKRGLRSAALWTGLLLPASLAGQISEGIKIHGRVLYAESQWPAERAEVDLLRRGALQDRQYTDSRGEFEFTRLGITEYVVRVRMDGYLPVERLVNMNVEVGGRGSVFNVTLLLEPDPDRAPKATAPAGAALSARALKVPEQAREEFEKGLRELKRDELEKSVPHFQKAIEIYPDFDEAYVQLGLAFFLQGKRSDSLRTLARAIDVYPKNARAFALLGKVGLATNQLEPSIDALEEALLLDETLWGARVDLGTALWRAKRFDEALPYAQRAHAMRVGEPSTCVLLATLLADLGRSAEALQEIDFFLAIYPEHKVVPQVRQQRTAIEKNLESASTDTQPPKRVLIGGKVPPPLLLSRLRPVFPPSARQKGIHGRVRLQITIAKDGIPVKLEVISGHPPLVPAALDAVHRWQYEPTLLDGVPVEVVTTIDVPFPPDS